MPNIQIEMPRLYAPQIAFCKATNPFVLYGGARGGGKSFVVRWKAIQLALKYPGITILIIRRTLKELENNHIKDFKVILQRLKDAGVVSWSETKKEWRFDNGSTIMFGYMDTDGDAEQYQGQSIEVIFMDEATHFTEFMFMKLVECNRLSGRVDASKYSLRPRIYLTANPGGVGHLWVKRLFIDRIYGATENPDDYTFIPAKVTDNEFIMKNDPKYYQMLKSLPEAERRMMLDGEWDVFEGQYFDEFTEGVHTFRAEDVTISPYSNCYRTRDYGLDMLACYWVKVDEQGTCWVYKGIEESRLTVAESAMAINKMTSSDEHIIWDICPPDMWNENSQTGKSACDVLLQYGQIPYKASNKREMGFGFLKDLLKINPLTGMPYLRIEESCAHLIYSMKMIQHDEKKFNDCAKTPHDITHGPDALRYFAISYVFRGSNDAKYILREDFNMSDFALNRGVYENVAVENDDYYDIGGHYLW